MIFTKKYSKKELEMWCERFQGEVLDFTNRNLAGFAEKVEDRLKNIENDLHAVGTVTVGLKEDVNLKAKFKKEVVNEILRKARVEIKNEALNVILSNYNYQSPLRID